jgi:sulfide:quinone oxidoreductase
MPMPDHEHIVILGAGFGGLELAACLSDALPERLSITLIDHNKGFTFGFSKLDVLYGRKTPAQVEISYDAVALAGVEFRREHVMSIDPAARRVVTDAATYDPDILVVALGADYDHAATPGFVQAGYEFYTVDGARRLHERLTTFEGGDVLLSILSVPFKCPPAPYEAAFLLHEFLVDKGVRDATRIELMTPMPSPIPVSPSASQAIVAALAARDITYTPDTRVQALDPTQQRALLPDGSRRFDLFIGVPVHRVPDVVKRSGLTDGGNDGWVAVDPKTLRTPFPNVYAIGDCADAPVPRAGVFAESAARTAAAHIVATLTGAGEVPAYDGSGACYLEFGAGLVGKVDANFLGGPTPVAPLRGPSAEFAEEKAQWAAERRIRWFVNPPRQRSPAATERLSPSRPARRAT